MLGSSTEIMRVRVLVQTSSQNQVLASELDRQKREEERRAREIQRVCEESEDLKHLEQQLRIAYINKERAAQLSEKQLLEQMEQQRLQSIEERMEYDRQMAIKVTGFEWLQKTNLKIRRVSGRVRVGQYG